MVDAVDSKSTGGNLVGISYNANGKEIYVKMKGALKDGVRVTKDWVQRQIKGIYIIL